LKGRDVTRFVVAACVALAAAMSAAAAANTRLTLGMALEPPHLDPTAGAAAAIDEVVYANVFEGLTRIDRHGAVRPALAQGWSVSGDGLTYTFVLHQGVRFHDGTRLDADDVVFSLERAMAADSTNAQKGLFEPIERVRAIDPLTVEVTLKRPAGDFLFGLGWGDAVIVARESSATNASQPVGTGPFRFARWVRAERVELVRNDDYWGAPVALESATFKFISDPAAAVPALLAGDVDGFANFPAPEALVRFRDDARFHVEIGTTEGETILAINNRRPPFDDVRVRRAIQHALDRQEIIDGAMFGLGTPIGSHFAPHHPAYVDLTGMYPHDREKAKALLAEAGLSGGFRATLELPPPTYARRGGEIVAAQLARVGIALELVPVEWAQWLDQVFKGADFDLTIVSHTEPLDIGIYAREDYYFGYRSAAFDATYAELSTTTDEARRARLLRLAQRLLAVDAASGYLFQLAKSGVWNARIEGLWENSPIQANDLTEVRWTD